MADNSSFVAGQFAFLVEDDLIVGMGLKRSLEELGVTVALCSDVPSALDALQERDVFDFAIVDINLAGELSSPVLDQLIMMKIYTIICTGYDVENLEERFQRLPRCEKPFTRAKMRRLLIGRSPVDG